MRALCSYLDAALYWVISDTYRSQLHEKKWTFLWGTPHFHHRPIETTTLRKWAWFGWRKRCLWAPVDAWGTYYCYDDVIAEVITVFITVFWSALATEMNTVLLKFQHNVDVDWLQYWNTLMKDSCWLTGFRWNSVCWHISEKYFKSRNAMPKITTVFYLCAYVHWINATRSFLSSTSIFSYFIPVFLKLQ